MKPHLSRVLIVSATVATCFAYAGCGSGRYNTAGVSSPWTDEPTPWGDRVSSLQYDNRRLTNHCPWIGQISSAAITVTYVGGSTFYIGEAAEGGDVSVLSQDMSERHARRVQPLLDAIELHDGPAVGCAVSEIIRCDAGADTCIQNGEEVCWPASFELDGTTALVERCVEGPRVDPTAVHAFLQELASP